MGSQQWSIGIAGGGIGGIAAALLLAADGHRVELFERSDRLGGRLTFAETGHTRIDRGPTIVLMPDRLLGLLAEMGVDLSRVRLLPCHPMSRIHYADGTTFDKWSSTERQLEEIRRVFPGEEEGFLRYMRDHDALYPLGEQAFLERPFLRGDRAWGRQQIELLLRMAAYRTVRGRTAGYFSHPRLVDAFSLQSLYIGGAPARTPSLYTFIPYAEHAFGVWYVEGGYASLLPLLEEALDKRGVTVHRNRPITGIRVEDGAARGFETADSFERFDAVVYNGDFPHLPELLRGVPRQQVKRRRASFVPSNGCLLLYASVNRRWLGAAAHHYVLPDRLEGAMRQLFVEQRWPEMPPYYVFNPVAVDPAAAPNGESMLYFMIPSPSAYSAVWQDEALTAAVLERMLEDAERRFLPGLRSAVTQQQVRTPLDDARDGLFAGGSFGIAPTMSQSGPLRPQIKPYAIDRLYAAGASIHPGGGIPIVMQGAKLLTDQIRKETT